MIILQIVHFPNGSVGIPTATTIFSASSFVQLLIANRPAIVAMRIRFRTVFIGLWLSLKMVYRLSDF